MAGEYIVFIKFLFMETLEYERITKVFSRNINRSFIYFYFAMIIFHTHLKRHNSFVCTPNIKVFLWEINRWLGS